jgi:hypothetical protein
MSSLEVLGINSGTVVPTLRRKPMNKEGYQYLAKCLAASVTANLMGNTVAHEMRVFKDKEPGDLYYALASLLMRALVGKIPEDVEILNNALAEYPK